MVSLSSFRISSGSKSCVSGSGFGGDTGAVIVDQGHRGYELLQLQLQFGLSAAQERVLRRNHIEVAIHTVAIAHDRQLHRALPRFGSRALLLDVPGQLCAANGQLRFNCASKRMVGNECPK